MDGWIGIDMPRDALHWFEKMKSVCVLLSWQVRGDRIFVGQNSFGENDNETALGLQAFPFYFIWSIVCTHRLLAFWNLFITDILLIGLLVSTCNSFASVDDTRKRLLKMTWNFQTGSSTMCKFIYIFEYFALKWGTKKNGTTNGDVKYILILCRN